MERSDCYVASMRTLQNFIDGGFKQSGYGKDLSSYALEDYTEIKHVMVSLS